ncbi:MAG TPA: response regulator transcription factor [Solirubrobacteraceae bacterium]|nr:response regulator transcription factor [Solirubrobacteraceae bacterium]
MHRVRLLIADRRRTAVSGIAAAFEDAVDVVVAGTCHEADELPSALGAGSQIEAAIIDAEMFDGEPSRVAGLLRARDAGVSVLLLTTQVDEAVLEALAHERVSCVSAYSEVDSIVSALGALRSGQFVLPPQVQQALTDRLRQSVRPPNPQLTRREEQVLALAATGLTISEIAAALNVSHSTAKAHLLSVYGKLGAPNRTAAVVTAVARGMLRVDAAAA